MMNPEIVATLKEMVDDTEGAVQNENIWALGAPNEEQASMHSENVTQLENRVENLKLILSVLEGETNDTTYLEDAIESVLEEEEAADSEYVELFKELRATYC